MGERERERSIGNSGPVVPVPPIVHASGSAPLQLTGGTLLNLDLLLRHNGSVIYKAGELITT
jgi:hypothetical protein